MRNHHFSVRSWLLRFVQALAPAHINRRLAAVLLAIASPVSLVATVYAERAVEVAQPEAAAPVSPVSVEVVRRESGYVLLRNGEPYFVRGVGGTRNLALLAELGGNSIRTWGHEELNERTWEDGRTESLPDRALRLGISICAGYWVGHERHGFDYGNPDAVRKQQEDMVAWVRRWKDHPAILMWAVGNEVELAGDTDTAFKAINDLAKLVKAEDPTRPTMTTLAGIWPDKAARFMELCPDVDIMGVNAYGGMPSVPADLKAQGMTKPYLATEFGVLGHWESPTTAWGAAIEQSSTEKAEHMRRSYSSAVEDNIGQCLGSYAFVWGSKQERTATWYGLLLVTGERTPSTDVLSRFWTGQEPANRAPLVQSIQTALDRADVTSGTTLEAIAQLRDPDGDELDLLWEVRTESTATSIGGDPEEVPGLVDGCIVSTKGNRASVRVPDAPGEYRLFLFARDNRGAAGTANVPFRVVKPDAIP